MHGFALNLDPDMDYFSRMNPCGITDRAVTSLKELTGRKVSHQEALEPLIPNFAGCSATTATKCNSLRSSAARGYPTQFEVDRLLKRAPSAPSRRRPSPILINGRLPGRAAEPEWMKVTARMDGDYLELKKLMRGLDLHTVCEEAGCPNIYECWGSGTATLMILGDRCTRACGFCNVTTGKPTELDVLEPFRAAQAIKSMGLSHAVITSSTAMISTTGLRRSSPPPSARPAEFIPIARSRC